MSDFPVGLREVIPNQALPEKCKEFIVNTGGTQSTLQDIKLPDCSGGFSYGDKDRTYTRNRFISWRVTQDVLELAETSLDWPLVGNRVRYKFQDTPLLPGITIHETFNSVVILVTTISSVHKMTFPHPNRIHHQDFHIYQGTDDGIPSIFAEASQSIAKDHFYIIPSTGTSPMPHTAASLLTHNEEAIFALANSSGQITLVTLGNMKGIVNTTQLKSASYLGRLWGNIGGMLNRSNEGAETAMSLCIQPLQNDIFVFGLCKDHKIRMWSATTGDCVLVADVLNYNAEDANSLQQGSQNHILKKIVSGKDFALAAFLCFSQHAQFCVFKPALVAGKFQLDHVATIYAPKLDLIDFSVTSTHLWALWTNADGEPVLRYASFASTSDSSTGWNNVILEAPLDPDFSPGDPQYDPRQSYLQQLFYPGRFSIQTLTKTVCIYRRCLDLSFTTDDRFSMDRLREEVCAAVEAEIQSQVTEFEISAEDYISLSHSAWSRFYSCALQYHQTGQRPMGLVCDSTSGLIVVIKKDSFSFVRPVDALEHLVLTGGMDVGAGDLFHDTPVLCDDPALAQDVISLMRAIAFVNNVIPPNLVEEFNHALHRLQSPDQIARTIAKEILDDDPEMPAINLDFTQELSTRLQQVGDVAKALEILLMSLELDRGIVSQNDFDLNDATNRDDNRLFGSSVGISVVAESLHQLAQTRYNLTRDVLILQILMLECGLSDGISSHAADLIHSTYLPRSVVMAHCYYVLVWLTETTATLPPANALEQGLRQMAVLKISETASPSPSLSQLRSSRPLTLSELFLNGPGSRARRLLTSESGLQAPWHHVLMPLVNVSAQLLWPRCTVAKFQEFLLSSCQYMQIQEYVRLLSTWCDWNCNSRQFLLGSALLNMGEPEKACDWIIQAADGIHSDQFLISHLFGPEEADPERLNVLYFLKVVQLFEQFGYYDFVIKLARAAMAGCDEDDPDKATLYYILFTYHLKLGHNDEAYDAMIANPDRSRRKDSLRQFIVTLFDRRQLRLLAAYPYIDMLQDLEQIIESRARSVDLNVNNYYDFLYSFHVMKENYRKAAHVMYECAIRLGTEVFNHDGLKRQAKCYLACLNALKLVNPKYAWIVKPVLQEGKDSLRTKDSLPPGVSPKHNLEGDETLHPPPKPKLEVVEMEEIQKEFEVICARLKLVNRNPDPVTSLTAPGLSASETVSLLIAANLYEDAIRISKLFALDVRPIVEGLASRCVRLTQARVAEQDAAWDWLADNNPSGVDIRSGSAVEAAWKLLEDVLKRLEERGQSNLHKAVVTRLFSLGAFLPTWIVAGYKKVNAAELLRLYLCHGYLEDAANLASEYISAIMGTGKEYFGVAEALNATAAPVWLPYNALDQLLLELRDNSDDPGYKKLYTDLDRQLDTYLSTVHRVSEDMIEIRRNC